MMCTWLGERAGVVEPLVLVVERGVVFLVVDVVDFGFGAAPAGPLSFRSPIWRSTMPMITATPMSAAPRNAAYPAPLATSPRPPPRCCRLIRSFCPLGAARRLTGSQDRRDDLRCAHGGP